MQGSWISLTLSFPYYLSVSVMFLPFDHFIFYALLYTSHNSGNTFFVYGSASSELSLVLCRGTIIQPRPSHVEPNQGEILFLHPEGCVNITFPSLRKLKTLPRVSSDFFFFKECWNLLATSQQQHPAAPSFVTLDQSRRSYPINELVSS